MVLEGREVEPGALGQLRECDDLLGPLVLRGDERAEGEFVAVVGHGWFPSALPVRRSAKAHRS